LPATPSRWTTAIGAVTITRSSTRSGRNGSPSASNPGACLHCHGANLALYRYAGKGDVTKGFEQVSRLPYQQVHDMQDDKGQHLLNHSIACVDCHDLHRKAQWRLDFVAAENSMGFHAPQEMARVLGESIDLARQGQLEAERVARRK